MRVHLLSDLHLEHSPYREAPPACDVVVLAGDVHQGAEGVRWAQLAFPDHPVVYVAGNHEYWDGQLEPVLDELRTAARGSNVHLLERDAVELGGVRFLGTTLWTDFALRGDPRGDASFCRGMPDFRRIRCGPSARLLRPKDTQTLHELSRAWLADELARATLPTVVVTHHGPHRASTDPRFAERRSCAAFTSHLADLIEAAAPRLWLHGHLHWRFDYTVGSTRVLSNPRGYPGEATGGFDPHWIVDLD